MTEPRDKVELSRRARMDELSRRVGARARANRDRRLRPVLEARVEEALGYRPNPTDFLDIEGMDELWAQRRTGANLTSLTRTWPEAEWPAVRGRLDELAAELGDEHFSYLLFFEDENLDHPVGALRVRSAVLLASAERFWRRGEEALSLMTDEGRDGFFLDYTDPAGYDDEYEVDCWGAFRSLAGLRLANVHAPCSQVGARSSPRSTEVVWHWD